MFLRFKKKGWLRPFDPWTDITWCSMF
jgi:hypothetical protein